MLIGVFSDAHGHDEAFELARARLCRLGCERLFFLGDSVGYIPSFGVVRALRATPQITAIKGNHEVGLAAGAADPAREAVYKWRQARLHAEPQDMAFLAGLPERVTKTLGGRKLLFVHGSPVDPLNGYVYPDTQLQPLARGDWDVAFMGHTHHPFAKRVGARLFVGVGSCGLPRDEDGRGCACVYDTSRDAVEFIRFGIGASSMRVLKRFDVHPRVAEYLRQYIQKDRDRDAAK